MVKSIIKRIIVGLFVALGIMFLKGSLIANVYASQIGSIGSGSVATSCSSCSRLDYNTGNSFNTWKRGTLYFNFAMYDSVQVANAYNWSIVPSNVYISANNTNFTCVIGSVSNPRTNYNTDNGQNLPILEAPLTARFSATCRVEPGSTGITSIHIIGLGNSGTAGIQLYTPITYEEDEEGTQQIIQSIQDNTNAQNNTTDAIEDTNDTLNDDSVDNEKAEDDINDMKDKVASNGTITQLLTLPIQLYQKILNSLNGSCSSISLGSLFGHNLTLTCINLQNILGSTLYNIIDILCCGLFILAFRKKMVDIFNHMTSLNDRGNELE